MKRKRTTSKRRKRSADAGKYGVDLSFLPKSMVDKINNIYARYTNLGIKNVSTLDIEEADTLFPLKITSLSNKQIGDLYSKFTAWHAFALGKQKYIVVALSKVNEEANSVFNRVLGQLNAEKGNIDSKKALAKSNVDYIPYLEYITTLNGMKIMIDSDLSSYEMSIQNISREVTRREHNSEI